jgi:hypothetical protein
MNTPLHWRLFSIGGGLLVVLGSLLPFGMDGYNFPSTPPFIPIELIINYWQASWNESGWTHWSAIPVWTFVVVSAAVLAALQSGPHRWPGTLKESLGTPLLIVYGFWFGFSG